MLKNILDNSSIGRHGIRIFVHFAYLIKVLGNMLLIMQSNDEHFFPSVIVSFHFILEYQFEHTNTYTSVRIRLAVNQGKLCNIFTVRFRNIFRSVMYMRVFRVFIFSAVYITDICILTQIRA